MPVNPILAPTFLKVFYVQDTILHEHSLRLYFDGIATSFGSGAYGFAAFTDGGHPSGWRIDEIVTEFFNRFPVSNGNAAPYTVNKVEVWAGGSPAPTFVAYDGGDYTGVTGGAHSPVAAAYDMYVFEGAQKVQWRVTFMDHGMASPQRFALSQPPAVDDLGLLWLVLKSAVLFSNQDGERMTLAVSSNEGVNRKLARDYGRSVTP